MRHKHTLPLKQVQCKENYFSYHKTTTRSCRPSHSLCSSALPPARWAHSAEGWCGCLLSRCWSLKSTWGRDTAVVWVRDWGVSISIIVTSLTTIRDNNSLPDVRAQLIQAVGHDRVTVYRLRKTPSICLYSRKVINTPSLNTEDCSTSSWSV